MAKTRKLLNDLSAPYMHPIEKLAAEQDKSTLATWVLNYSERVMLPLWLKYYPDDTRPQVAIEAAYEWLAGKVKLPSVKEKILACHAAAREVENNPAAQAAARAIGQSASTVHSARHSIRLPAYGALAVAYDKLGVAVHWSEIEKAVEEECARMLVALQTIIADNEKPNTALRV